MTQRKPKRRVYRVQWDKARGLWKFTRNGKLIDHLLDKSEAVRIGIILGNNAWAQGIPAQLLVHKKNGQIQANGEYTYGNDPAGSPG